MPKYSTVALPGESLKSVFTHTSPLGYSITDSDNNTVPFVPFIAHLQVLRKLS